MPKARVGNGVSRTLKYSPWRPKFSLHPLCSSAVRQRRQRPMDQFPDGHYVWLRSRVHGTYLHADKDGRGVYLSDRPMSMKSAWAVHLYGDEQRVLLHNAANGRYLSATNSSAFGCRVALRNFDDADDMAIRWQPVRAGFEGPILLRQFAVDGRHGYLRANGRDFPLYNKRVTVDNLYIISTMMEWVVQAIPTSVRIPQLQGPPMIDFSALLLSRVVTANGPGHHANVSFSFRGRHVFRLREELIRRLGIYPGRQPRHLRPSGRNRAACPTRRQPTPQQTCPPNHGRDARHRRAAIPGFRAACCLTVALQFTSSEVSDASDAAT